MNLLNVNEIKKAEEKGFLTLAQIDQIPSKGVNWHRIKEIQLGKILACDLRKLPDNLKTLRTIITINLSETFIEDDELANLPPRLQDLNLSRCLELSSLRPIINLVYMKTLNLEGTYIKDEALENIPPRFLESLNVSRCVDLTIIPEVFKKMNSLRNLDISETQIGNDSLLNLPTNIKELNLSGCQQVDELPDWSNSKLSTLILDRTRVEHIDGASLPRYMVLLSAKACENLTLFEISSEARREIKEINLSESGIEDIRALPKHIEIINLHRCGHFSKLSDAFHTAYKLKELMISGNSNFNLFSLVQCGFYHKSAPNSLTITIPLQLFQDVKSRFKDNTFLNETTNKNKILSHYNWNFCQLNGDPLPAAKWF